MKISNIIIGENSLLTSILLKKLKNSKAYSSKNLKIKDIEKFNNRKKNYIFNNFYPSFKLNDLNSSQYEEFVELSLSKLSLILSQLKSKNVNKIIYTSSSSIYNLNNNIKFIQDDKFNRIVYSSFKFSAEKLIQNYCKSKKIDFYIMRLFNTYGDESDKFSLIERLVNAKKNNLKLKLNNNGIAIRDFVHLSDVSKIYKFFLNKKYPSGVYDIGTGKGHLIKNLFNFLDIKNQNIIRRNNVNEITKSIADISNLNKCLGNFKFKALDRYLKSRIKIKKNKKLLSIPNIIPDNQHEGSIIYGAGYAGKELLKKLFDQKEKIFFFVDDNDKKQNTIFQGIPVISFEDLKKLNYQKKIDKVYIAIPSIKKNKIKKLNQKLRKYFFDIRNLPERKFLINNEINLNDLEIDQINSFINRKQIKRKNLKSIKNRNVLVTGAVGTIGFEICRQLLYQKANKIIGIDQSEIGIYNNRDKLNKKVKLFLCNVNDKTYVNKLVKEHKIDLIIHAAAYKHVNILEDNLFSAISNNIFTTKNLCEIAKANNTDFILISTDKAADPTSILGYTKKVSENLIHYYNFKKTNSNFFNIVRFGNVFGSSGSAVTKFIDQINKDEVVTITNKRATRFFMTILEACYLVLETTSMKLKNKTFVLNMGKPINIYDIAKKIGQLKETLDTNYKFNYIETGLKQNEKLHEILFDKNEKIKKINQNIFYVSKNNFNISKFIKLFSDLEKNFKKHSKNKLLSCLKLICRV